MLLKRLQNNLHTGTLHLSLPDGRELTLGRGAPEASWRLHSRRAMWRIASDPELELGETYVAGQWDSGPHGLLALLEVLMRNFPQPRFNGLTRLLTAPAMLLRQWNRVTRSYRNVAHHYDLDEWLFRKFLDSDMHYSCAYFPTPEDDLETAQQAKCEHILRKLRLKPGQRVLDIGSGWGSLGMYLAEHAGVEVTGLTLSREQLRVAESRARQRGLERQVSFLLQDYRLHQDEYDAVVSVGMFEHVGLPHYRRYFRQVGQLLKPEGVALIHTIGQYGPPCPTNAWIHRHIFPGGYIPALSEVSRAVEQNGLITADVEVLRLHYADTLAAWQAAFQRHRAEVAWRMDERFCRMWEFYLASCEAAFRWRDLVVYQFQLAHRLDAVPRTRDYLYRKESPAYERLSLVQNQ